MNELVLSIGIITYNQEKYIAQTLDSILSQEHNYDFEIIVGDDCSEDSTRSIVENYAAKYPNIVKPIYNEKNCGLIKNYYNVIKHCKGKYVMECAGDDFWLAGKVQKQINYMEAHPEVGLCYGKAQCVDEDGTYLKRIVGKSTMTFNELLNENGIPAVTVCFKRSVFDTYFEDVFPESKPWIMEDYPLWLWISKSSTIYFMNDLVAAYRMMPESVYNTANIDKKLLFEDNVYQIRTYFANRYGVEIEPYDREKKKCNIMFEKLLFHYDKENADKLKQVLKPTSFKNVIMRIMISSKVLMKLYYYICV
ncbi:MAG: glycosyltransferase [Salinivirgaceae bacterium]|nr:glycosyltransferase [Salinivirgaceae bacterium]